MGWSWKKELIQIPSVGHLKCDRFKQNVKQDNCVEHTLEHVSPNSDDCHYSSSIIHLCHYFAETYEEESISTTGDSSCAFSGQISAVETASIMINVDIDISQLSFLLGILRNKVGRNFFKT